MQKFQADEAIWMLWHAKDCVMLGRNQVAEIEVDLNAAKQQNIMLVRRSSGGGTIFADLNTLQYTLILPYGTKDDAQKIKRECLATPIISALNQMGIPAKWESRNDIYAGGKKISGLAQYVQKGRICSHGSLLYDTNLSLLEKILRADETKIKTRAMRSFKSGVDLIKRYCDPAQSIFDFWEALKKMLFWEKDIREYILSAEDISKIQKIQAEKYANPNWTFGESPHFSYHSQKRFPGGKVEVFLDVFRGAIASCAIKGDFLAIEPICALEEKLVSCPYESGTLLRLLCQIDLEPYLGNITKEQLMSCLFENCRGDYQSPAK